MRTRRIFPVLVLLAAANLGTLRAGDESIAAGAARTLRDDPERFQGRARTRHLSLKWSSSHRKLRPGQRVTLILQARLKPGVRVFAPGEHRYLSATWDLDDDESFETFDPVFPPSEIRRLPAIQETVPTYEGSVRWVREVRFRKLPDSHEGRPRRKLAGTFRYQACDERGCHVPVTVPLAWTFRLGFHDRTRAPEPIPRDSGSQSRARKNAGGYSGETLVWGSSYSAALVFLLAAAPAEIGGVLSLSPGEYLGSRGDEVRAAARKVTRPVLVPTPEDERQRATPVFDAIASEDKKLIVPERAVHGSSMPIAERDAGAGEVWPVVFAFLERF